MKGFFAASQPRTVEQANYYHLVMDIAWFGLALPATTRFLSVYAIHLGADVTVLTWLASLPAFILLFAASLGNWWMRRHSSSTSAVFWPGLGFRLSFLLPALTPFLPVNFQPIWLIFSLAVPALPQGLASVAFLVMFREAVEDKQVPPLLSRRSLALNIAVGLSGLALGAWLERAPFPFNYQAMFLLAFVLSLISFWHVWQVRLKPAAAPIPQTEISRPVVSVWRQPIFLRVVSVISIAHLSYFATLALVPLHMVKNLHASEAFMGVFALAELAAGAFIALFTRQIAARIGTQAMIAFGMVGTAVGLMLIATASGLGITLAASALIGASWTAAGTVGLFAYFSENVPSEDKTRYTTAYTQVIFLTMFIGPLIGRQLSSMGVSLVAVLIAGAVLRLLAGLIIEPHSTRWIERAYARFSRALHLAPFTR